DDVEARSLLRQQPQDGERRVRLDGVADRAGTMGKRRLKKLKTLRDLLSRVHIERGSLLIGQRGEGDAVAVKDTVTVDEGAGVRRNDLRQVLGALYRKAVRRFGDNDPRDDI